MYTYLRLIPAIIKTQMRSLALANEYADRRLNGGSHAKDLFYYLVSIVSLCFHLRWFMSLETDRRGRAGGSEAIDDNHTF